MIKKYGSEEVSRKHLRIVIMGNSGVGKTSLFSTVPDPSKTVILNLKKYEDGLVPLSKIKGLSIWDIETMDDMKEAVNLLAKEKKFNVIGVDSLTGLSSMALDELKLDPKIVNSKNGFMLYQEIADYLKEVFFGLKMMDAHIIWTSHMKVPTGLPAGLEMFVPAADGNVFSKGLNGWTDIVGCLKKEDNSERKLLIEPRAGYACKNRFPIGTEIPNDGVLSGKDVSLSVLFKMAGVLKEDKNG